MIHTCTKPRYGDSKMVIPGLEQVSSLLIDKLTLPDYAFYAVALALHEQLLPPDETIPVIDFEDGHPSGHRDIPPDLIMTPTEDISLDAGSS